MKRGLPLERHREIGARLRAMRNELLALSVEVANAYPHGSKVGRAAARVVEPVDRLRSALDDAGFAEHPETFAPSVYYGAGKDGSR